jgi:hypothetical protein
MNKTTKDSSKSKQALDLPESGSRQSTSAKVINFLGFQIGWFSSVIGAAHGYEWVGLIVISILVIYSLFSKEGRIENWKLFAAVGLIGTTLDSILIQTGLVNYVGQWKLPVICPLWVTGLWINFALTIRSSLSWLIGRYWQSALLSAAGGLIAYLSGESLGAVQLTSDPLGLVWIAVAWAAVLPIILKIERLLR